MKRLGGQFFLINRQYEYQNLTQTLNSVHTTYQEKCAFLLSIIFVPYIGFIDMASRFVPYIGFIDVASRFQRGKTPGLNLGCVC